MVLNEGFRYDPQPWVDGDDSLQATLVRKLVFDAPRAGDADRLDAEMDRVLSAQQDDGSFYDSDGDDQTNDSLMYLLDIGVDPARPAMQSAADAMLKSEADALAGRKRPSPTTLAVLTRMGRLSEAQTETLLAPMLGPIEWYKPWMGCPWSLSIFGARLWSVKDRPEVVAKVREAMQNVLRTITDAGTNPFHSPMGHVDLVGIVDVPESRDLLLRLLPIMLRRQLPDGSWGERTAGVHDSALGASVSVLRALVRHGLYDRLRAAPPLEPDFEVMHSIELPQADTSGMAWDGIRFWLLQRGDAPRLTAVSPDDGHELARIDLPPGKFGSVAFDGTRLVTGERNSKQLTLVDPADGSIETVPLTSTVKEDVHWIDAVFCDGDATYVFDAWWPWFWRVEPDGKASGPSVVFPSRAAGCIAPMGDGTAWFADGFSLMLVRTDLNGNAVEFGAPPFEGRVGGMAWDGDRLWALETTTGRLHAIERVGAGRKTEGATHSARA